MANKAKGFGMSAEIQKKKMARWNADLANEAIEWIIEMMSDVADAQELLKLVVQPVVNPADLQKPLQNGRLLCMLINRIKPGTITKISKLKQKFQEMENIGKFLAGAESLGCSKSDMFQSVELHEADDMSKVVDTIHAVARKAQKCCPDAPCLGPAEADCNKREFTEEQIEAGKQIIGLQMGTNQCASQAGQNFGQGRQVGGQPTGHQK